ncbi:MAG: ABC transporter substrate-binding protein [Caldilineaceae bacterium]|nr:ABC transporter substrate-binding protein [Caldilineaceae bacterium]
MHHTVNRSRRRKYEWLLVLGLVSSLLFSACAPGAPAPSAPADSGETAAATPAAESSAPAAAGEKVMTGAWVGPCCNPIEFLNPLSAGGGYHWFNKIFSHLVTYNLDYTEILPDLAESWSVSDDGLVWTLNLRQGVTWHDGTPFTADDVIFSVEVCVDPNTTCWQAAPLSVIAGAQAYIDGTAESISGLVAVDETTLQVTTDGPSAPFLDVLAETWIVQKASLGEVARDQVDKSDYWATQSIGTGPFKFTSYVEGQYIETVRFDAYWRGAPKLDRLIRREFKDPATALLAFDAGEIDFTYLTSDEVEREAQNANAVIHPGPSQVDNAITLNPEKNPVFGDPKFRQAILYAIDRASIIESLYGGAATAVPCLYGNPIYYPADIEPYDYNPEKAKELLAELGVDLAALGTIPFDTYYNDQLSQDVMTVIQQNLADVGIQVELMPLDGAAWSARYYDNKESSMSLIGGANGADPNRAYQYFYSASPGNNYKYANTALDELLDQGRKEMDPAARVAIYQDACRVLGEDQPWIFLWQTTRYGIVSTRISDFLFTPAAGGGSYYDQAELWDITE